jgi:hypothetical protein
MMRAILFAAFTLISTVAHSQSVSITEGQATNACASLMGHASSKQSNPQLTKWAADCSRSTTSDGLVCRLTREEMLKAGEPFAGLARRMDCRPDPTVKKDPPQSRAEAENTACLTLMGYAQAGVYNAQVEPLFELCSRSTKDEGLYCRTAREELERINLYARHASRLKCLPGSKSRR